MQGLVARSIAAGSEQQTTKLREVEAAEADLRRACEEYDGVLGGRV